MLVFLRLILGSIIDRVRGGWLPFPWFRKPLTLLYGMLIAISLGILDWTTIAAGVLFWIGEKPGWGEPFGAIIHDREMRSDKIEWWQVGVLRKSPYLASLARGLLWSVPLLPLAYFHIEFAYVIPLIGLSTMVAAQAAHIWYDEEVKIIDAWEFMELLRGVLFIASASLIAA